MKTCLHCANWDLKDSSEMTKLGYGWCRKKPAGFYSSSKKECDGSGFVLLDEKLIEKRERYFNGREER